jgi:yeast amino acid transporter
VSYHSLSCLFAFQYLLVVPYVLLTPAWRAAKNPIATGDDGHDQTSNPIQSDKHNAVPQLVEADLLDKRYANTQCGLKSRYVQIMALGGATGTGLFDGSGQALVIGAPVFLFAAYLLIPVVAFSVVTAIAEIAAYLPVHGGTMS